MKIGLLLVGGALNKEFFQKLFRGLIDDGG